jgi:hypothetical protein
MINNLLTQITVMFIFIGVGYIAVKSGILLSSTGAQFSKFLLVFVIPSVLITAFQIPFETEQAVKIFSTLLIAMAVHFIGIATAKIIFGKKDDEYSRIIKFSAAYGNCGFFGLPLLHAAIGDEGVLYGAAFMIAYNVLMWTHGVSLLSGREVKIGIKEILRMLVTPGVLGSIIGIVLYAGRIALPNPVFVAVRSLSSVNTPLAMVIIGAFLADSDIRTLFTDRRIYLSAFLRLITVPLIVVIAVWLLPIDYNVGLAVVIASATPVAAGLSLQAVNCGVDESFCAKVVSAVTIMSVATIPVMIAIFHIVG